MFSFFAQHGISYTPSFIFRPYYPCFQTSEICRFSWVSFRIIFSFFPSVSYHSSFSTAELNAFWNQVHIFFSFFSFLIPLFSLTMISLFSFLFFSPFSFFLQVSLSTAFSPWTLHSFSSVEIHLSHISISAHFCGSFDSLQRCFYTFFHISLEERTKEWKTGKRETERPVPFKYPESVALSTFHKCSKWDDKHPLCVASFLFIFFSLPMELLFL